MNITTPMSDLYEKLRSLGWTLRKVELKNGLYVAKGVGPAEQEAERVGRDYAGAIAALLLYAQRSNAVRAFASLKKVAAWSSNFLDQKDEIARAYSNMPAFDEKAVPAWRALAAESKVQADAIRQQIKVDVSDDPEPYPSAQAMVEDIHKNKHFSVSRANSNHPIWSEEDNINFRIVHDVLGHAQSGGDFTWTGENLACGAHFPLVSPLAREALFTECIGQTAYYSVYHGFGPQKVGLLSQFLHPAQEQEGEHVFVPHGGVPTLMAAPNMNAKGTMDQAPGEEANTMQQGTWVPGNSFSPTMMGIHGDGSTPVMRPMVVQTKLVSDNVPQDPNADFDPKIDPGEKQPPVNPTGDPGRDYLDLVGVIDNANKIDTEWWARDEGTQKRAIVNAFRVAILSPRKHLKWNAAHYQALQHLDPHSKAVDMWDTLEREREKHNQMLGHPEGSHLSYKRELDFLSDQLEQQGTSKPAARAQAKQIIFEMIKEYEQLPEFAHLTDLARYNHARKLVDQWLKEHYSPAQGWQPGQMALAANEWSLSGFPDKTAESVQDGWGVSANPDTLFEQPAQDATPDFSGFGADDAKYGAFMGAHLDALEHIGDHIDLIRSAALEDVNEGHGHGYIFRNSVLNMNLPGVNPKVCSFAWLLLRPMTSELGIVDTHILRALRSNEGDMSVRDYYKFERMQKALKDASGYHHVPLGIYHWGMWDAVRNPGHHSDHSPLRILDPVPWDDPEMDWGPSMTGRAGMYVGPPSFEAARPAAERVGYEWDNQVSDQPRNLVPIIDRTDPAGFSRPIRRSPFIIPKPQMVGQ